MERCLDVQPSTTGARGPAVIPAGDARRGARPAGSPQFPDEALGGLARGPGGPRRASDSEERIVPMAHERYEVELHCGRCSRTTVHLVAIGDRSLSRVMCIPCGRAVAVDTLQFMEQYVDSVMRRLLAKPFEITTEFTRSPREFITSLPSRVLTKPFRVAAELRTTMDIVRLRRRTPPPTPPEADDVH